MSLLQLQNIEYTCTNKKKIQIENVKEKVEHIECEWISNEDILQL